MNRHPYLPASANSRVRFSYRQFKTLLPVAILGAVVAGGFATSVRAQEPGPGTVTKTLQSGGRERTYHIHAEKKATADKPAALVLVLHGSGGNGLGMERATGFSKVADREGFIVVYADGIAKHWNDGRQAARLAAVKDVDDVRFLRDLVAEVSRHNAVDPKRIFCTGLSNGGFMSNRAGVEAADLFAAIAPVSGTLGVEFTDRIAPKAPISVLAIHGTKDLTVPYEGGEIGKGTGGTCLGVPALVAKWVKAEHCQAEPVTSALPDTDPKDGCTETQALYSGGDATVELVTITGGVHAWPGPEGKRAGVCHDLNGAEFVWAFFAAHPKP